MLFAGAADVIGGAGGGAIEIVAAGNLTVASLTAKGSGGSANASGGNLGGAGGGAGGGILLSGGTSLTVNGPVVDASGSAGSGTNSSGGGGGRIALAGLSSYTLTTSSPFAFNLSGGAGSGAASGFAGVVTVDALSTIIPNGASAILTGGLVTSVAGSTTQNGFTVEAYIRHDVQVIGTATLGMTNAFQRLDASGNNITTLFVDGTFDMNNFSQTIDRLFSLSTTGNIKLGASSILTVGVSNATGSFPGQITGAGGLVKSGSGTLTLSGANSFTGQTMVTGGSVIVGQNQALQNSTVTLTGGNLSFSGAANPVIGALAGTNSILLAGLTSLNVGGNSASTTYAGNLTGSLSGGLTKAGSGTWTLSGTNTQSGPINVQGGAVLTTSSGALSANALITVSPGATLDLNGYNYTVTTANQLAVQGALRLGGAGLSVASGATATYNGGMVSNGFLLGSGTHALTGGATLAGVTTATGVTVSQTGAASVLNFTNNGQFNNAAGQTLNWSDGTNTSAGRLTVGGAVTASDFVSNGVISINGGGAVNNSGSNVVLGGGSRTTINPSGTFGTAAGTSIELNGGVLVNNGMIGGTTDVNYGSLAKGTGVYGVVNVGQGGVYCAGQQPGNRHRGGGAFRQYPDSQRQPDLINRVGWHRAGHAIRSVACDRRFVVGWNIGCCAHQWFCTVGGARVRYP